MAPVRSYTNWNNRSTDQEEQREPYRKYFFICEGANTETWYFRKLIDIRKTLNIHPLIDIRLLEKTEKDRDISFPRKLIAFAESPKENKDIKCLSQMMHSTNFLRVSSKMRMGLQCFWSIQSLGISEVIQNI